VLSLHGASAEIRTRAPTAVTGAKGGDTPPEVATGGRDARQEIERRATLEVAPHLLKGLTDLRIHLGFDRDGREEILRDAVRLTLVGTRRLEKLSVHLDLDRPSDHLALLGQKWLAGGYGGPHGWRRLRSLTISDQIKFKAWFVPILSTKNTRQ